MKTIGAKELRNNLGEITRRVGAGEHIYVSYRNKLTMRLEPALPEPKKQKHLEGLAAFLVAKKRPAPHNPNKTVKQIYHELLDEKYDKR